MPGCIVGGYCGCHGSIRRVGVHVNFTSFNSGTQIGPPGKVLKVLGYKSAPKPPADPKFDMYPGTKISVKR